MTACWGTVGLAILLAPAAAPALAAVGFVLVVIALSSEGYD